MNATGQVILKRQKVLTFYHLILVSLILDYLMVVNSDLGRDTRPQR